MKNTLLLLFITILLVGCGSNKGFHKKHHSKLKWVKVDYEKVEKDLAQEVTTSDEKTETVVDVKSDENQSEVIRQEVPAKSETAEPNITLDAKRPVKTIKKTIKTLSEQPEQQTTEELNEVQTSQAVQKIAPKNKSNKTKTNDNSDIVYLALLILVILLILWLLPPPLSYIINLFLTILLILLILRWLGVI